MKRLPPAPLLFIVIALIATAIAVLDPAAEAGYSPIPLEVHERVAGRLPSELPSFEAREDFAGSTAEGELEAESRPRQAGQSSRAASEVSDHNETDNDLPFEESLGSNDPPSGETGVGRNLRASSGPCVRTLGPVELAHGWLKKAQREDGSWDGDAQTTGLVLLAFLGAGETHKHGRYKKVVRGALKWLKKRQAADGWFTSRSDPGGQALATLALCEAYRLTASPLFKQCSLLALDTLRTMGPAQDPATWWMLFAQQSAKQGKLLDAIPGFERAIDLASPHAWSTVPGGSAQAALGAEILARVFSGEDPRQSGEIEYLVSECLQTPPSFDDFSADPGAIFLKTQALLRCWGDAWKKWNGQLKEVLLTTQIKPDETVGYWESSSPRGRILGRTQTTALMVLTVEVYYRYGKVFGTP